jgi:SAM-dependent methyltransferase
MSYRKIVDDVIEKYKAVPIDILGIGDGDAEYAYLNALKESYVRTVRDIDALFGDDKSSRHIVEIGSFLGPVSISLKHMGYHVSALDIPEFVESASLRELYCYHGIPFSGVNLRYAKLPFESNSVDAVITCEVIEHLNFNPLPALKEINRVLGQSGYVYIGMPNQSDIHNRVKMALGRSVHNPIPDFFKQLDRNNNMIVGLHWREYTMSETVELIEAMGFELVKKYYFSEKGDSGANLLKATLKRILFMYPPFRTSQVVIGRKIAAVKSDFWLTDANA